jgi:hypothetical protein
MPIGLGKNAGPRNWWQRRKLISAVAVVLLSAAFMQIGVSTATAADGPAGKPGGSGDDSITKAFVQTVGATAINNQDALSRFRAWMLAAPGFANSGYVGSVDDLQHKATTVLWAGPRTALLSAIVRRGAELGIAVSVQQRSHTLQQIDAAVHMIWQQAASGAWAGFSVSAIASVGVNDDGLTVYGTYTATPAAQRAAQVRSLATSVLGVPVRVVPGVSAGTSNGRDNDFAPFDAGGYMISPSSSTTCSTGFGINLSGTSRVTTARHCTRNDYQDRAAANTYGTGVVNSGDGGGRVLSASAVALALDGAFNSDNFVKTVIGFEDLGINDFVCTGGGNSGEHCNVKVVNLNVSFNDGIGTFATIEGIQQTAGAIAQIQGDSGGPVISLAGTASGQVRAAGMIQGFFTPGMTGAACGAVFDAGGNQCTANVLFSSMRTVVNSISGAALLTG